MDDRSTQSSSVSSQRSYSQLKHLPDEDLIGELASGCHDALTVLFERYYRLVPSIASRILRDPAEAEGLM